MSKGSVELCVAMTTARTPDEGRRIAQTLVGLGLATCVNVLPGARSVYRWQGAIEEASEAVVLIKTSRDLAAQVRDAVRQVHSYDLPELVVVPIVDGCPDYLAWLAEGLTGS